MFIFNSNKCFKLFQFPLALKQTWSKQAASSCVSVEDACAGVLCSPAAGVAVKRRVLHSMGKDQLNERSMKEGLQEVDKHDPVKSEVKQKRLREEGKAGSNSKSAQGRDLYAVWTHSFSSGCFCHCASSGSSLQEGATPSISLTGTC